jgi:hypothetical protein
MKKTRCGMTNRWRPVWWGEKLIAQETRTQAY